MKKTQGTVVGRGMGSNLGTVYITVYNQGLGTKPTIYSDNGINPQANPFSCDAYGRWAFYVANGRYDIEFSGTMVGTYRLEDELIEEVGAANAVSIQGHAVDEGAVGNDKILVYKTSGNKFVYEAKGSPTIHATSHQDGGGDEINITGLSGLLSDAQNAAWIQGHIIDETDVGNDKILVYKTSGNKFVYESKADIGAHAASHQDGGGDEIDVTGLSGVLIDRQDADHICGHIIDESALANDRVLVYKVSGDKFIYESKGTPSAHANSHEHGGGDEISLPNVWGVLHDLQKAAGAQGRLQFYADGILGADSELVWDNTEKRLGIGISPVVPLHVFRDDYGGYPHGQAVAVFSNGVTGEDISIKVESIISLCSENIWFSNVGDNCSAIISFGKNPGSPPEMSIVFNNDYGTIPSSYPCSPFTITIGALQAVHRQAGIGFGGEVTPVYLAAATNIVNSTVTIPINIQSTGHGLVTGDWAIVSGHIVNLNANGLYRVTRIDSNNVTLDGSGAFGTGGGATGTIRKVSPYVHAAVGVLVGLGTTTPVRKLELTGVGDSGGTNFIRFNRNSGDYPYGAIEWANPSGVVKWQAGAGITTDGYEINQGDGANRRFSIASDGYISFGTYSAKGAEAFAGYITMKDIGGTLRKMMICA